jgi:predicted ATPase
MTIGGLMKKIKIVVTGGPSGGKTTLIEALQKDMSGQLSVVPEAASILYRGGFPRKSSAPGRKHTQRAICFVQRELEDLVTLENHTELIVCDRGSLDSIAYWPGDEADFFKSLNTTRVSELQRYDWVIHLDTASQESFDTTNQIRIENHKEAIELNLMIKQAWAGHPHRIVIQHSDEFLEKIAKAKKAIKLIISGKNFQEVNELL